MLIDGTTGVYGAVDPSLWHEPSHVGVVRKRADEFTLIEVGGGLAKVPPSPEAYDEGNTVEFTERDGVRSVLASQPLRARVGNDDIDQAVIDSFKIKPEDNDLTFEEGRHADPRSSPRAWEPYDDRGRSANSRPRPCALQCRIASGCTTHRSIAMGVRQRQEVEVVPR